MKKTGAIILCALMVLSLAACSRQENGGSVSMALSSHESTMENGKQEPSGQRAGDSVVSAAGSQAASSTNESDADASADVPQEASSGAGLDSQPEGGEDGEGKALVVYYSASGHTENVAEYIAAAIGADTFALEPVEAYSSKDLDWTDQNSRVVYEHDNPDARAVELVASTVEGWESYDTVFIGYPIWWGIAAWPVNSFVEANDFTGKTVVPFCTSSTSGLGESGELLAKEAGTGNWLEGERFSSSVSEETVKLWVEGLELNAE